MTYETAKARETGIQDSGDSSGRWALPPCERFRKLSRSRAQPTQQSRRPYTGGRGRASCAGAEGSATHIFLNHRLRRTPVRDSLLDEVLSFFGGRAQPMMAKLVESGKLTRDDIRELEKAVIQQKPSNSEKQKGVRKTEMTTASIVRLYPRQSSCFSVLAGISPPSCFTGTRRKCGIGCG